MNTRSIAQGGMMTGVSVVLLCVGTLVEVVSGAAAVIAALIPAIFFLRGEAQTGRLVYGATSILAVFILPDKFTALVYALVLGLYTTVRFSANWEKRLTRLACKTALTVFWIVLSIGVIRFGFVAEIKRVTPAIVVGLAAGWSAFLLYYDFCAARIFNGMRRWLARFR